MSLIDVLPRTAPPPTVTPRPSTIGVTARQDRVVLRGTPGRPEIDFGTEPVIPAGPPEGLDAENGDNLMTEAGERMTTEYS
jgi:hypothetical protein